MVEVVAEVEEMAAKAARCEVSGWSDDALAEAVGAIARVRASLDAFELHVLAELASRGWSDREVGLSTGTWFARQAGVPASTGRCRVRVARVLHDRLDDVDRALVDGRISFEHAQVLARACNPRVVDAVAGVQGDLVALADGSIFEAWRREVLATISLLDEDGGHDPRDDLARNRLSVVPTIDGLTHVSGTLTDEHGAVARQAIETVADELFRQFAADHERVPELSVPERGVLRALAFVELCRRGLAVDVHATVGPRPDVTLVVPADDPDLTVTGDGVRLADGTTRMLRCDADVHAVVVDRLGVPLDMGRRTRRATPAQRRALAVRDGGCAFPGCGAGVNWCDAHHLVPFGEGGGTDVANLVLLCRAHHGVTHRQGWTMRAGPAGRFTWTTPSGRILHAQRHGRTTAEPP